MLVLARRQGESLKIGKGNRMKRCLSILIVVCVLLTASSVKAEDRPTLPRPVDTEKKENVFVKINCKDDSLKSLIRSFINRELRSLGTVNIMDADPNTLSSFLSKQDDPSCFELNIIAVDNNGVCLSVVVSFSAKDNPSGSVFDHMLLTGGSSIESIRELCTNLVVSFESSSLESFKRLINGRLQEGGIER
jgi:hypothetical protein